MNIEPDNLLPILLIAGSGLALMTILVGYFRQKKFTNKIKHGSLDIVHYIVTPMIMSVQGPLGITNKNGYSSSYYYEYIIEFVDHFGTKRRRKNTFDERILPQDIVDQILHTKGSLADAIGTSSKLVQKWLTEEIVELQITQDTSDPSYFDFPDPLKMYDNRENNNMGSTRSDMHANFRQTGTNRKDVIELGTKFSMFMIVSNLLT